MKLHILIDKHRISQRELSQEIGVRFATINNYVNNTFKYISKEHINKLCTYFDCELLDLIEYIKDNPKD